jgi:hypothetical protein
VGDSVIFTRTGPFFLETRIRSRSNPFNHAHFLFGIVVASTLEQAQSHAGLKDQEKEDVTDGF